MSDETSPDDEPNILKMTRPEFFFGEEPDSVTVRSDLQIYAQAFGAQGVQLTLDYGIAGNVVYQVAHPEIVSEMVDMMSENEATAEDMPDTVGTA